VTTGAIYSEPQELVLPREDFCYEVLAHVSFPIKIYYAIFMGIILIGYNPVNQTPFKKKIPQKLNPTKFLKTEYGRDYTVYYSCFVCSYRLLKNLIFTVSTI
jgi:hypothetical protein